MRQYTKITVGCMVLILAGCSQTRHETAKNQAQENWSKVRSRIKRQLAQEQFEAFAFKDAAQSATQAIMLDPSDATAYVILARAQMENDEIAAARRTLRMADAADLRSADLTYTEGVILERQGLLEEALEQYRKAGSLDATNIDYLVAEAECLTALHQPEQAQDLVDRNMDRFSHDVTLCVLAGHLSVLTGDVDQAIEQYRQALLTIPDDRMLAEICGLLLVEKQRYVEALGILEPLLSEQSDTPVSGTLLRALASCHLELNDPQFARNILEPHVRATPADAMAQILLAKAALAIGDLPTAIRCADKAGAVVPQNSEVYFVRAIIEWKQHNYERAAYLLEGVLSKNPDDVEAHCLLAETLTAQGDLSGARRHFEHALRTDSKCIWAASALRRMEGERPTVEDRTADARRTEMIAEFEHSTDRGYR